MELKFENLGELDQFMQFCAHVGRQLTTVAAPDLPKASEPQPPIDSAHVAAGCEQFAMSGEDGPLLAAPTPTEEKPKRARRTKAEMEAVRAGETVAAPAETAQPDTSATTTAAVAESAQTQEGVEPRGNPFAASPSTKAILDAPNQSAATLAGVAAMQQSAADSTNREERVARIVAEGVLTDSLAHLKHCQKFIQQHGMTVYEKSFVDGLTPNIAVYTAEQCALHVAVMEELV